MKKLLVAAIAAAFAPSAALATTGYFAHGYGMKAKGMGGVGIALPQDSLAAATNPAGMALVGNRFDVGVDWFRPDRGAEITGSPVPGLNGTYDGNGTQDFLLPEFGYNRMIRPDLALGVSVYGNGGMNTDYKTSPFGAIGGQNPAGVDLAQLFISPTIAYKMGAHAFGVSLNLAYQRFKAEGLQPFDNPFFSSHPGNVTNQGYDSSTGWGLRFGWTGQVLPTLTLGVTYQTKTQMGKFDKYKGLFAEQGGFDIPENYGVGVAWKPTDKWTIAADIQRINYGDVASVGHPIDCLFAGACQLGSDNGAGFGWQNTTVYKLGVAYEMSQSLTLRGGFVTLKQPIPQSQTFFNIVAPGVVENHVTAGATWTLANKSEITAAYMHAFENKVNGQGSIPAALGGGEANLRMSEDSLGIAWGMKF
ncbi:MAG TPA: outer membrane protein transport protein [Burkholderiales bacterium]|jgi:long-chain fatty acid transport protein|nr:outer membrane protein transport protein [Burkholderiales bacterium]